MKGQAQIQIHASSGTYDSILSGTPIYYQYSWDDPLEEVRDSFKLFKSIKAFGSAWDSAIVSEGSLYFISHNNPKALLIVDGTGWDLIDKGWEDTINYPNLSPVIISSTNDEVEWRNFGFTNELDSLDALPSTGNLKIKINFLNVVDLIYGDFAIVRPDLCFEGFGSLHPSITYKDSNGFYAQWFIFGNPADPTLDTISNQAFDHLPVIGQKISLDFTDIASIIKLRAPQMTVSPNPVVSTLNITGAIDFAGKNYHIIGFDGRIVDQGKIELNKIDTERLKHGNYILKIQSESQFYYARFLKVDK